MRDEALPEASVANAESDPRELKDSGEMMSEEIRPEWARG
jgi:hypothetical protein